MITNTQRRHDIVGTGGAGPFSYQFMILNDTDLAVYVDGNLKTLTTHYTVSGVGNESGGTITFTTGNYPALSADIILLGAESETQTHDFQAAAVLPAASLEESVDKLTRLVQQLTERVNRAPVLPVGDSGGFSALTLPAPGDGQYLRWSGNQLALGTPTLVPDDVPAGGGNYDHLIVNGSGAVAWGQALYHYAANFKNIALYGNSLSNAVSSIGGSTKVCLLISESISVTGNITVTENITFFFAGAGGLAISSGVTVTYNAASFIVDDIRRQRFSGSGTFDGVNLSEVIPDQWGADYTGANDSTDALKAAIASLPATGGKIKLLTGTYDFDETLACGTKPIIWEGQGQQSTILNMTTSGSALHGITGTGSLALRHFTIQVQTPLTTDQQMYPVRMDLDGSGITGGRSFLVEHMAFTGWNAGPYSDGGANYGMDTATYQDCYVKVNGPAATYIGSGAYMNRPTVGTIRNCLIDQNNTGEHAIYCFGPKNLRIEHCRLLNASLNVAQAVKVVGDGVGASVNFGQWVIEGIETEGCFSGVLVNTFLTETLGALIINNCTFKDTTNSTGVLGPVMVVASGTSTIYSQRITNIRIKDSNYCGFYWSISAGAAMEEILVDTVSAYNWGKASAGTYALFGCASPGTIRSLTIKNVRGDGNSNGRTIWSVNAFGGYGTTPIKRLKTDNLIEVNCPTAGWPASLPDNDATPSLAFGNDFVASYTSATNVTALDDMVRGETYRIRHTNSNLTFVDGANLVCPGSVNLNPGDTDVYSWTSSNGTAAYCAGGSNN